MQAIQSDQSRKQRNTILVGFMDFEKGFDSIEHQAMFEALQNLHGHQYPFKNTITIIA